MSKLSAAHLKFYPVDNKPSRGKWQIHPLPLQGGEASAVVTFSEGVGGNWEIEPAPFITTSDPKPPETFVTVYDSTTITTIGRLGSSSHDAIAAYDDGLFQNVAEAKRLYPNHTVMSICVRFGDRADWADTESGNMNPEEAVRSFIQGLVRGIYADKSTWNTHLVPLIHSLIPVRKPKPLRWVADWTGHPHLPILDDGVRADACQWDNHTQGRVNTDVSLFSSHAL